MVLPIPVPPPLEEIMADPLLRDGGLVLIDASVRRPAERINVSLRLDLLEAIDRATEHRCVSWRRQRGSGCGGFTGVDAAFALLNVIRRQGIGGGL